jgi:hypothetical protein
MHFRERKPVELGKLFN